MNQSKLEAMTFHMAQELTGHGCYQHCLWKRRRAAKSYCMHCEEPEDTVEHTLFNWVFLGRRQTGDGAMRRPATTTQ